MNQIPTELQSAIDQMAKHLAAQRAQSIDESEGCCYRSDTGEVCAIGCLFSDKAYQEADRPEWMSVDGLLMGEAPEVAAELYKFKPMGMDDELFISLLTAFQGYHDRESWCQGSDYFGLSSYIDRIEEYTDKPNADLEAAIKADFEAIYHKTPEDAGAWMNPEIG